MTERTANQIKAMKQQTIGVEVEMNNITRQKAAKVAAEFFGTGRYENTAGRNGYSTWSAWDAQGREWKFQKDVSIAGPDEQKCELVTPILTYQDIETLQELCRQLRHAGAKSDASRGCGVHIHIGAKGHTAQSLRNLANIMASHESLIAEALKLDRSRMSRYCRTVDPQIFRAGQQKKAQDHGGACRHLVHQPRREPRQEPPLQRQPLPHIAQPSRHPLRKRQSSFGSSSSDEPTEGAGAASTQGS